MVFKIDIKKIRGPNKIFNFMENTEENLKNLKLLDKYIQIDEIKGDKGQSQHSTLFERSLEF